MLMYDMIIFCNKFTTCMSMSTTTIRSLRVVFNYWITCVSITKCHVIDLLYHYELAIVVEAIVGETTTTQRWRSKCRVGDDGAHDDALEMEIKSTRYDGHITSHILIAYDVYILCILFCLVRR